MDIPGHDVTVETVAIARDGSSYPYRAYRFICSCKTFDITSESLQDSMQETLHHLMSAAEMTPLT